MSNPSLCALLSKWLGTEAWIRNADLLAGLRDHVDDSDFRQEWKMVNFLRLFFVFELSLDREEQDRICPHIPFCSFDIVG